MKKTTHPIPPPRPTLSRSAAETAALGERFAAGLSEGFFVALCGGLGAGKTVFAGGVARGLGVEARVLSPTFQLVREYEGRLKMFHLDFYRLDNPFEADHLDLWGFLERGVVVAEWADRFPETAWPGYVELKFEWVADEQRRVTPVRWSPNAAAAVARLNRP